MAGYKVSIDNVRKLSRLNCDFEDVIREVMMSQGRRFCSFEKPRCEQEVESQKTDTQHGQLAIALMDKLLSQYKSDIKKGLLHSVFCQVLGEWCSATATNG